MLGNIFLRRILRKIPLFLSVLLTSVGFLSLLKGNLLDSAGNLNLGAVFLSLVASLPIFAIFWAIYFYISYVVRGFRNK